MFDQTFHFDVAFALVEVFGFFLLLKISGAGDELEDHKKAVQNGAISPFAAAQILLEAYFKNQS